MQHLTLTYQQTKRTATTRLHRATMPQPPANVAAVAVPASVQMATQVVIRAVVPPQVSETRMSAPVLAYIGLGANLGDARAQLQAALQGLRQLPQTELLRVSPCYRTAPVDATGPDYLNAVAELRTTLAPLDLLRALQALEQDAGRERPYRNAPRTLDLDVLLYGDLRQDAPVLTVPHPRMEQRAFVLRPLADLRPDLVSAPQLEQVRDQPIAVSQPLG